MTENQRIYYDNLTLAYDNMIEYEQYDNEHILKFIENAIDVPTFYLNFHKDINKPIFDRAIDLIYEIKAISEKLLVCGDNCKTRYLSIITRKFEKYIEIIDILCN